MAFLLLPVAAHGQKFKVSFAKELSARPFSGNVYIFLSKNDKGPIKAEHLVMMNPVAVAKVSNLMPGHQFTVNSARSEAYPVALDSRECGEYYSQLTSDLRESAIILEHALSLSWLWESAPIRKSSASSTRRCSAPCHLPKLNSWS